MLRDKAKSKNLNAMMPISWRDLLIASSVIATSYASAIDGRAAAPVPADTWKDWTCPLPSTVSLSFTEYVPVTTTQIQTATTSIYTTETTSIYTTETTSIYETATTSIFETDTTSIYQTETSYETITQPTTLYQTIISTEIVTIVESTTETDTVTTPTTTTSPITLTATELEELFTVTSKASSLIICPTRITNPTFTLAAPLPSDWTWGCPPGWLCKPKQEGCNFEAGLPDRGFYCAPNECEPAEALPPTLPTWDATIYGNDTAATNPALVVNAIDSFFNMNPTNFGLTYQVFVVDEVFVYTSTILLPPSPTVGARQAQTSVPSACYPWCNNCLLEAQSAGKSPKLCNPGSAFEVALTQCEECINVHRSDASNSFVEIAPQFQQFLDYCAQFSTAVISTVATQTTSAGQNTYTTLVATTSATIVPTSAASSYSTILSTSISETSVSTATLISSSSPPPSPTASSKAPPPSSSSVSLTSVAATTRGSSVSSAPLIVYTTTSAVVSTSTAPAVTYNGTAVTSITIIMSSNGTAVTVSGSELSTYTVIIPSTTTVSSYETTMTMTSAGSGLVGSSKGPTSVAATTESSPPAVPASSSTASAATSSAFTGNAASDFTHSSGHTLFSLLLGWLVMLI